MDFNALLKLMRTRKASDLFVTSGSAPSLKINGKLTPVSRNVLTDTQARNTIYRIMPEDQINSFERNNEANFAYTDESHGRYRVNVFRQQNQIGMVMRRIENNIPTIEQLNLPELYAEAAMFRQGLVLIVGATGSGKSTSLAAMINHRNEHSNGHIIALEDPIEFIHKPHNCIITQREVGFDTADYETGLQNALRQAPDMVVIGEIRSRETMSLALQFAETGHLCVATLHSSNSNQAFDRIMSFFPKEQRQQRLLELSLSLKAIIAQRLVPAIDKNGRRVASEILINTPLVSNKLLQGDTHEMKQIMSKYNQHGMRTFEQSLYEMYKDKLISYEEALCHADSANELRLMIKLNEHHDMDSTLSNMSTGISLIDDDNDSINISRIGRFKSN